jgi:DNA gyrase subunit A
VHGRGGQGVISIQTSERNGQVVGAVQVVDEDEVMMITNGGTLVRNRVADVSSMGRNTQGVIMIRLSKEEKLIGIERVESLEGEEDEAETGDEIEPTDSE